MWNFLPVLIQTTKVYVRYDLWGLLPSVRKEVKSKLCSVKECTYTFEVVFLDSLLSLDKYEILPMLIQTTQAYVRCDSWRPLPSAYTIT